MSEQHLQFSDGSSNKFWKIRLDGNSFTVNFGKVGTAGQVQTKQFAGLAEAEKEYNKLVAEKLKKGYIQASETSQVPPAVDPKPAPQSKPAPAAQNVAAEIFTQPAALQTEPQIRATATATLEAPAITAQPAVDAQAATALPAVEPAIEPAIEREILFTDDEWKASKLSPEILQEKPLTQSFDLSKCINKLLSMPKGPETWGTSWVLDSVNPLLWSLEESHFWLVGCSAAQTKAYAKIDKFRRVAAFEGVDPAELSTQLQRTQYRSNLTQPEVEQLVRSTRGRAEHFSWTSYPLARLLSPTDFLNMWEGNFSQLNEAMFTAFNTFVAPYLNQQEREVAKEHVREMIGQATHVMGDNTPVSVAYLAAAALGMKEELLAAVQDWPDKYFAGEHEFRQMRFGIHQIIFGIGDAEMITKQARRLGLRLRNIQHFLFWIACTKYSALDLAFESLSPVRDLSDCMALLKKVISPEAARYIFLSYNKSHDKNDKEWLDAHPLQCFEGLLDLAHHKGNDAQSARRYLRDLAIKTTPESLSPELEEKLKAIDCPIGSHTQTAGTNQEAPDWLLEALNQVQLDKKKNKTPEWLSGVACEAVILDGYRLNDEQIEKLIAALQQSSALDMHPLIVRLRERADRRQFDLFTWDLFSRWVSAGGPPKDKWAMYSLGFIASEKSINQLVTMMQDWRESGHHQRAQSGLEALRLYGTDYALMRIHEISQSPKLKSLRSKALEYMEEIAESRGLTKPELEDRIVPTCGLDQSGSRTFDFGARQFSFVFAPDLKPMVRDEKGAFKADLPAPNQKDDSEKARQSVEEWKEMKKQLKTVSKIQARRLEQAMVTGRSWSTQDFHTLLLNHPLMTNLMRLVVWVSYDKDNKPLKTFRVTEDRKFSDESDRQTEIDGASRMAVIHPLHMSDEQKSKWGEIFTDYEIVALFPQIGRPVYKLEGEEIDGFEILRFKGISVPAVAIPGTLERLNWWRGPAEDNGVYSWHYKHFYEEKISAVAMYDGIPMAMMQEWDPQTIERVFFVPTIFKNYWEPAQPMPLKHVPEAIISEVLYDMHTLTARGKEDDED